MADTTDLAQGLSSEILVISAQRVKNDDINGVSVMYTFNTDLRPEHADDNTLGQKAAKVWLPDSNMFEDFQQVPGIYSGKFLMKVGSDGKPVLTLKSVKYKGPGVYIPCYAADIDQIKEFAQKLAAQKKEVK